MMERLKRRDVATGAEIRMATIDAIPVSEDLGVFESVPRGMNSKELADTFAEFGSRFYGTAGVAFMDALIADVARRGGVEVMREHIAKGVADWVNVHARHYNGQILRVAKRFALVAVAGELATEYGVLPWSTGEASNFADACFRSFVENFETSEQKELRLCQGVIDYVVAFPENFNSVYPDGGRAVPSDEPEAALWNGYLRCHAQWRRPVRSCRRDFLGGRHETSLRRGTPRDNGRFEVTKMAGDKQRGQIPIQDERQSTDKSRKYFNTNGVCSHPSRCLPSRGAKIP